MNPDFSLSDWMKNWGTLMNPVCSLPVWSRNRGTLTSWFLWQRFPTGTGGPLRLSTHMPKFPLQRACLCIPWSPEIKKFEYVVLLDIAQAVSGKLYILGGECTSAGVVHGARSRQAA